MSRTKSDEIFKLDFLEMTKLDIGPFSFHATKWGHFVTMNDCLKRLIKKIDKFEILVGPRPQKIIENQKNPWKFDKNPGSGLKFGFWWFF